MPAAIRREQHGFVNTPIYRGSTVLYPSADDFMHRRARYTYGTKGTPTTEALETRLDASSPAPPARCSRPPGLAAVTLALMSCLKAGDHLLVTDSRLPADAPASATACSTRFGVETTYYDPLLGAGIAALFRPNTTAVFTEAPGSQTFEMQDIPAIAAAAHAARRRRAHGQHLGDAAVLPAARARRRSRDRGRHQVPARRTPTCCSGSSRRTQRTWPALRRTFDSFAHVRRAGGRLPRPARPAHHGAAPEGARAAGARHGALARRRARRSPACSTRRCESDPGHAIWKRDFTGSSGLFSIVLEAGSEEAVAAMLDGLELFGIGSSWGGFESLVDPVRLRRLPHRDALGSARARPCASISGSRISTISRPISMPGSRDSGVRPRRRLERRSGRVGTRGDPTADCYCPTAFPERSASGCAGRSRSRASGRG